MEATYNPRYYFDLRKERKNAAKGESAYTFSSTDRREPGASLDYIARQAATPENPEGNLAESRKKLVDNAETCAAMTRAAAEAMGLKLFSRPRVTKQPQPRRSCLPRARTPASSSRA